MLTPRRLLTIAALAAVSVTTPVAAAGAATRAPIKDCGDVSTLDDGGFFLGAVTAQRTACTNARAIARTVARSAGCKRQGSCRRLNYTCLLAKAGKELTLVRCEGRNQTAFVRFEFGS
jgi:hypothetical protein